MSIPQFRTLAFLKHYPDSSLSQLAEFLGLTLPSASKIVDGLVEREIVARRSSAKDRRRIKLSLTDQGRARYNAARQATQARLAELIECLSESERASVIEGMRRLRPVFDHRASTSRKI